MSKMSLYIRQTCITIDTKAQRLGTELTIDTNSCDLTHYIVYMKFKVYSFLATLSFS